MSEVMELVKEAFGSLQGSCCDRISTKYVAKVHERCQALHHFSQNMTSDSGNIDLFHVSMVDVGASMGSIPSSTPSNHPLSQYFTLLHILQVDSR